MCDYRQEPRFARAILYLAPRMSAWDCDAPGRSWMSSGRATVIKELATCLFFFLLACACLPKAAYAADTSAVAAQDGGSGATWYAWASTSATSSCDDHCDTQAEATQVALPSQTAGRIEPANDDDYFRFEVASISEVRARTTGSLDTYGALYDSSGQELAANDDGSILNLNFSIQRVLAAGTYYVRVSEFGRDTMGDYTLHLEVIACDDHCDTRAQATPVALPSQTAGRIDPADDDDHFRFEVASSGQVRIRTSGGLDTHGALYDSSGRELATDDDGGAGSNFRIERELAAGAYHVRVTSVGNLTGAYTLHVETGGDGPACDDHCDTRTGATRVALPSQTAGRIDPANDDDYFRFVVASISEVHIRTTGSLDTYGVLYDSSGQELATDDDGGEGYNFRIQQELAAGTYYVRISELGRNSTGAYTLHLEALECDDHCDSRLAATLVSVPSQTAGRIDPADDYDYFRFVVASRSAVLVRTTGSSLDTYGALYDSSGRGLATDDDGGTGLNFRIQRELAAGTYYVRVSESGQNSTGAYTLHVEIETDDEPTCDDHCGTRAEATRVALPSQTAGRIDPGDDSDFFRFEVSGTTSSRLHIRTTGGLDTRGALQRSDGGAVASDDNAGEGTNFRIRQDLTAGVYYVRVTSAGSATGAYTLHIEIETDDGPTCDDHCDTRAEATRVALPSQTAGRIDPANDDDYFRFEVSSSAEVRVRTTGGLDTYGALYDSSGRELATDDDGGGSRFNFGIQRVLAAGVYYLRVSEFGRDGTGAYTLHLEEVVGCDDHCDTRSEATRVALPSQTAGRIDPGDDSDFFRFEVVATSSSRSNVNIRTTGSLDTQGTLQRTGGEVVASDDNGGDGANFRIREDLAAGVYYVRVTSAGSATGAYALHIEIDTGGEPTCDDHCDTRLRATAVALPSKTVGRIDPGNDSDFFRFVVSGTSSSRLHIRTTGGLDTQGTLQRWDGGAVASDDNAGDGANFRIRADLAAGTYYVRVTSAGSGTGPYTLHIEADAGDGSTCDDHCDARSGATRASLPSATAGRIDPDDDDDYFRFEVSAQGEVLAYTTGRIDTYGALYDSAGQELATNDDGGERYNFRIQQELAAGVYYVRVSEFGRNNSGAYTLHIEAIDESCDDHCGVRTDATRVALPSQTAGRIDPADDDDYFRFEVSSRAEVRIRTTGGVDTYGTLYDSSGQELATDDDSGGSRFNFGIQRVLAAGVYYVQVSEFGRNRTGAYTLHLAEVVGCDDHCDTRSEATRVALPSRTAGRIDPGDDSDFFRFEVVATSSSRLNVSIRTTGSLDTQGVLQRTGGEVVASDGNGGDDDNFRIRQDLAAGVYYVRVASAGRRTGAYTLHIEVGAGDGSTCDDHCDTRSDATHVTLRSQTAGRIDPGDDSDYFRFEVSGTSSSRLHIRTTGRLDTRGALQRSNGGSVATDDNAGDGANFRIRADLTAGVYYVRVTSAGSGTGAYMLHIDSESSGAPTCDDHCDTRAEATRVALRSATAGRIDPADDDDYFHFEVAEQREVAAYTTGRLDTYGVLYDSSGEELATNDDSGAGLNFHIQRVLAAGAYYVRVSEFGRDTRGAYTLHLTGLDCDDHCDTRSQATRVALPSQTAGQIDSGDDQDFFRFEVSGTSSNPVHIRTTGSLDTQGVLQRSDGGAVATDDNTGDGTNFRIRADLTAGVYYVRVTSAGSATGAYALHIETETGAGLACDDHCDALAGATQAALPSATAGRIDPANDDDYFRFEVAAAGEVAAYTTGDLDSYGALYDSAGEELATDDDSGAGYNFRIQRELAAGVYYVRVSEFGRNGTGAYTLHLQAGTCDDHCDTRSEATQVALRSQTAGAIDPVDDDDYFRFEMSSRGEVRIRTTGGLDTYGALYDSAGEELATNDDGASRYNFRIERELAAGTYYIRVSEFGRNRTGAYTLHVEAGGGPCDDHCNVRADATQVSLPSETAGRIDPADDDDYFRFEVPDRRQVTAHTTSRIDTYGVLYDSSGEELATDDDGGADFNFRIQQELAAGTYYIRVSEFRRNDTGDYTLHLSIEGDSTSGLTNSGYRTLGDFDGQTAPHGGARRGEPAE